LVAGFLTGFEGIQYPTAILVRSVQDLQRSAHNINDSIKFFKETVDKIGESSNNGFDFSRKGIL